MTLQESLNGTTIFGFPSEFVSKEEKQTKGYGLKVGKAIWSVFNYKQYYSERKLRYIELRKWAEGLQSIDDMKDLLSSGGDLSYLNLDWSGPSIVPKFVDVITSLILNNTYRLQVKTVDPLSLTKKDKEKAKMYANSFLREANEKAQAEGLPPLIQNSSKQFKDKEDVDLYMNTSFKLATEIAMTLGLEYVFTNNDRAALERRIVKDLVEIKIAGTRVYLDVNKKIRIANIDPVNLVTPFTNKEDYSDINYAGEIVFMTIGELKRRAGDNFTEEQYYEIARGAEGAINNAWFPSNYRYYPGNNEFNYYDFKIMVLNFNYLSIDNDGYAVITNKYGNKDVRKKDKVKDYKNLQKRGDIKFYEHNIQNKYCGSYIIGTEFIFDYGLADNVIRERIGNTYSLETPLDFQIYAPDAREMQNKSDVERMLPYAKQMHLAVLKIQQFMAKARPPGVRIDVSQINNIVIGKGEQTLTPMDLGVMYDQIGNYLYNSIGVDGQRITTPPVEELQNRMGEVERLINVYNFYLNLIRNDLGLNEITDASTPSTEAAVGIAKLSANATSMALRPLKEAFKHLMVKTAKLTALYIQDSTKYGDGMEIIGTGIGTENEKIIELGKDLELANFGLDIVFEPEENEKALMDASIMEGLKQGYLKSEDMIILSNIMVPEQAYLYLTKKRVQYEDEAQARTNQNSQVQAQANAEAAKMAEQAKAQAQIEVLKAQSELEQVKSELKKQEINVEYDRKRELLQIELSGKYDIAIDSANTKQSQTTDLVK